MAIKRKLTRYGYHVVIAIDQLFNALTGGAADETLSSRTYRGAILAENPKKRWQVLYRFINGIFFDRNHCKTAYESEVSGKQHDERFKAVQHG
ncbi:DNA helicase UvrD [Haemophilus quentini]|uniref:DNA helicase UvrD n=1 Tax=Haemophilus quentini TaxID=123834 RepID=A0ABX3BMA4_9PAST|nr:DNA helicase UvrD [Haemophilus quentini]OEY74842.1 DNA helicase UvrD [Haemophilus quentini]OEY74852.1 DNA helicase UvrD [Haemophilus quentini]